jgi:tetratricopeptide (TPR) repeat protein
MRRPRPTVFGILAILGALALAAATLYARDNRYPPPPATERLLYLTSGTVADRMLLSFDALAADVYWIRVIQHYGRDRKSRRTTSRFELLQPLLDLTTSLDPHFLTAYRFGAIFLAMAPPDGPGRPDQAIALLEKGLRASPDQWLYAHDIGFIHYWHTGNFAEASNWFERAGRMSNAPAWIGMLAATTRVQGGNRAVAAQMLKELLQSPQAYIRQSAERGLRQLQALEDIDQLQNRVDAYYARFGKYPVGWNDLVRVDFIRSLPIDPSKTPYTYDAVTHMVSLSKASPLSPLPQGFLSR